MAHASGCAAQQPAEKHASSRIQHTIHHQPERRVQHNRQCLLKPAKKRASEAHHGDFARPSSLAVHLVIALCTQRFDHLSCVDLHRALDLAHAVRCAGLLSLVVVHGHQILQPAWHRSACELCRCFQNEADSLSHDNSMHVCQLSAADAAKVANSLTTQQECRSDDVCTLAEV